MTFLRSSSRSDMLDLFTRRRIVYFAAKFLNRADLTLHEVQCHLDHEGASDLVIELVMNSVNSPSIFVEAVTLGIALLEGGNPIIQKSMYNKLVGGDLSHAFFKVRLQTVPSLRGAGLGYERKLISS